MPSSTFFIFVFIIAIVFAFVGKWLYLLFKKAKMEEQFTYDVIDEHIEDGMKKKREEYEKLRGESNENIK